jgi:hypothetical protein
VTDCIVLKYEWTGQDAELKAKKYRKKDTLKMVEKSGCEKYVRAKIM